MPRYSIDLKLRFDCVAARNDAFEARCQNLPGVNAGGATQDAALRAGSSLALRVMAELVAKGDPRWRPRLETPDA